MGSATWPRDTQLDNNQLITTTRLWLKTYTSSKNTSWTPTTKQNLGCNRTETPIAAQILFGGRRPWRNHVIKIWWRSVQGFLVGWGSKFAFSHILWRSSLQHSHGVQHSHYRVSVMIGLHPNISLCSRLSNLSVAALLQWWKIWFIHDKLLKFYSYSYKNMQSDGIYVSVWIVGLLRIRARQWTSTPSLQNGCIFGTQDAWFHVPILISADTINIFFSLANQIKLTIKAE